VSEQLLPCPFCGGKGTLLSHEDPRVTNYSYQVVCGGCDATGASTDCDWNGDTSKAKDDAVRQWNTRADLHALLAAALADEREANAKACDDCYQCGCAAAIRARGGA
jgi:Lar family restriction alleviation protein